MNLKFLAKIQIYQPIALPSFNNAIMSRKDDMAHHSDALLFKAESEELKSLSIKVKEES